MSAMPISLIATMTIKPECEAEFLSAAREFVPWVQANEPGTLLYVLTRHPSREHTFVWLERFRDEAAVDDHRKSEQFAAFLPRVRECLAAPTEGLRLEQVIPD